MLELGYPSRQEPHHRSWSSSLLPGKYYSQDANFANTPLWTPPIQRTVSTEGAGIPELASLIERHKLYLQETGAWQRRERLRIQAELEKLIQEALVSRWRAILPEGLYTATLEAVVKREISPYEGVERLLAGNQGRNSGEMDNE